MRWVTSDYKQDLTYSIKGQLTVACSVTLQTTQVTTCVIWDSHQRALALSISSKQWDAGSNSYSACFIFDKCVLGVQMESHECVMHGVLIFLDALFQK